LLGEEIGIRFTEADVGVSSFCCEKLEVQWRGAIGRDADKDKVALAVAARDAKDVL